MTPPESDPPIFTLLNEIGIIAQLAQNRFEAAQPDGLRLSHFVLLNHLVRVGDGSSQVRIARALQLAKSAITNTVQRLEERGLLRTEPDPADGRGRRVFLTPEGRARRVAAVRSAAGTFAHPGAVLAPDTLAGLIAPLRALREQLDRDRDGA